MNLYAATSNPGKLAEFATSASTSGIDVLALPNLANIPEPIEDTDTFLGNATLKALAYSLHAPNELVFADDSGLEVLALNNAPGVRSARFADDLAFEPGSPLTKDQRNNLCLLSLLAQLPNPTRNARFVCSLALARNGKILLTAEGETPGELLTAPRGKDGFGYDPLFLIPHLGLTLAELSREQKWQISHRGNAFRNLLTQLKSHSF
jgi:XTP/dITP diphosphohydrolase